MEFMFLGIKLYNVFLYCVSMMSVRLSILFLKTICYKALINKCFKKIIFKKNVSNLQLEVAIEPGLALGPTVRPDFRGCPVRPDPT